MSTTYPTKTLSGQKIGRWRVLNEVMYSESGQRKWLCQCECGTRRYVLERSLLYGESESCGCLRRERAAKARSTDLTGQIFGDLTVLRRADGAMWLCRCACGEEYVVQGTLLTTGRRTRCGGKAHRKNYAYTDIEGQRFGSLTALLFDGTAAFYEKWNARAKADPAWAARNPVKISVSKDEEGRLSVSYSPSEFG